MDVLVLDDSRGNGYRDDYHYGEALNFPRRTDINMPISYPSRPHSRAAAIVLAFLIAACNGGPADHPIDQLIAQYYGASDEPGLALMVVKDGEVVYRRAHGVANVNTGVAITAESNFRLASVTKQMTALSVMLLSDQGLLDLDAPLTDLFPGFPQIGASVTPRMPVFHTSGLWAYESLVDSIEPDRRERLLLGQEQLLDADVLELIKGTDSTYFPPGTAYRYNNTGYALLALLVEQTSGVSFPQFLKENIFEPLGMTNTIAYAHDEIEVPNRVYGHSATDSGWAVTDQSHTSAVLGDGGIYSSLADLEKWYQFLSGANNLGLSHESYTRYFAPGTLADGSEVRTRDAEEASDTDSEETLLASISYAFGWMIGEHEGERMHFHTGSSIGFRHTVLWKASERLYVVLLTNRNEAYSEFVEAVFGYFLKSVH
jgi:CubicO group peptidase (beta-lactamase class C family)